MRRVEGEQGVESRRAYAKLLSPPDAYRTGGPKTFDAPVVMVPLPRGVPLRSSRLSSRGVVPPALALLLGVPTAPALGFDPNRIAEPFEPKPPAPAGVPLPPPFVSDGPPDEVDDVRAGSEYGGDGGEGWVNVAGGEKSAGFENAGGELNGANDMAPRPMPPFPFAWPFGGPLLCPEGPPPFMLWLAYAPKPPFSPP